MAEKKESGPGETPGSTVQSRAIKDVKMDDRLVVGGKVLMCRNQTLVRTELMGQQVMDADTEVLVVVDSVEYDKFVGGGT